MTIVEEVRLEDLRDEDARPDGFSTADELRAELALLYPKQLADGHRAYRIVFELMGEEETKAAVKADE